MSTHLSVIGFHSCDKEIGLKLLHGDSDLKTRQKPMKKFNRL